MSCKVNVRVVQSKNLDISESCCVATSNASLANHLTQMGRSLVFGGGRLEWSGCVDSSSQQVSTASWLAVEQTQQQQHSTAVTEVDQSIVIGLRSVFCMLSTWLDVTNISFSLPGKSDAFSIVSWIVEGYGWRSSLVLSPVDILLSCAVEPRPLI